MSQEPPPTQTGYWDRAAGQKVFGHPLDTAFLRGRLGPTSPILDVGCGYGRLCGELLAQGFQQVIGVDSSSAMIQRARRENARGSFLQIDGTSLPFPDESFSGVLLFAVLTSVPRTATQQALIAECHRVLRAGGLLVVSDLLLQDDERSRMRYELGQGRFGDYGTFETDDGCICRHHTQEHLSALLNRFDEIGSRQVPVVTMNGHPAVAYQYFGRKQGPAAATPA